MHVRCDGFACYVDVVVAEQVDRERPGSRRDELLDREGDHPSCGLRLVDVPERGGGRFSIINLPLLALPGDQIVGKCCWHKYGQTDSAHN